MVFVGKWSSNGGFSINVTLQEGKWFNLGIDEIVDYNQEKSR